MVRPRHGLIIEAQRGAEPGHVAGGEPVLLAEEVGDGRPDLRVVGDQRRPAAGLALEILNRRAQGRLTALDERIQEGEVALAGGALDREVAGGLARAGGQVGRPALDQVEQRVCPTGGEATEDLLAAEQGVGGQGSSF
jgi:hypothetical protein